MNISNNSIQTKLVTLSEIILHTASNYADNSPRQRSVVTFTAVMLSERHDRGKITSANMCESRQQFRSIIYPVR